MASYYGGIDQKALLDSYKGLSVIYIIGIVVLNGLLIYKTVRNRLFIYNTRSLVAISMAIGDIFLALFPLVFNARYFYEDRFSPSCSTQRSAKVYSEFLLHFVYGTGLIIQAVDLVMRYKRQTVEEKSTKNIVKGVVFSAVPWILGLLIVLPLTMAGTETDTSCWTTTMKRYGAMYAVSNLLPAILALIVCIVVMCLRLAPLHYASQAITYQGASPGMVLTTQTATAHQQYPAYVVHNPQYPAYSAPNPQYPAYSAPNPQYPAYGAPNPQYPAYNPHYPAFSAPNAQTPANNGPNPQYPTSNEPTAPSANNNGHVDEYPSPATGQTNFPTTHNTTAPQNANSHSNIIVAAPATYQVQPQVTPGPVLPDPGREKNILLVSSIIFFVCVIPFSSYMINLTTNLDRYYSYSFDVVMNSILIWLLFFRSLLTPLIWIACSRK